jgi:hypothetical protein
MPSNDYSPENLKRIRQALRESFELFCRKCVKIRTKDGEIKSLVLNRVQQRFLKVILRQLSTTGRVRIVVLKARQQGLSTVISAFQLWWLIFHTAQKGIVIAHESDSTTALFDMYRRAYDNLPEIIRPHTRYSSRTELVFDQLDCAVRVATAGGRGIARGETITVAHLSEVGFWPLTFANQNFGGMIKAIPNAPGTIVFVESTANGMTGKFRELWVGAVKGKNEFEAFFSAWYESDEYRRPAPADFQRTPEEDEIAVQALRDFGIVLDNDQLQWRRIEIGRDGADMFAQECPAYPEQAFLNTGAPVFDPKLVQPLLDENKDKSPHGRFLVTHGSVTPNSAGPLKTFFERSDREQYTIGADVGMGIRGKDYSVAQVLDSKMRQVAVWRGYCHPDVFADILVTIGYFYNTALIACERNNHGLLTCVKLRDSLYPNLYIEQVEGQVEIDKETLNYGIYTTEKNKPLMVDKLRASLRDKEIKLKDPDTLEEMLTFVVNESGRMEAEPGTHDDCVMSLAIATHVHEGVWNPAECTDEYYVEAI